jgi:hypothetical protein
MWRNASALVVLAILVAKPAGALACAVLCGNESLIATTASAHPCEEPASETGAVTAGDSCADHTKAPAAGLVQTVLTLAAHPPARAAGTEWAPLPREAPLPDISTSAGPPIPPGVSILRI